MSRTQRDVAATPEKVWAVLADGWLFPLWVVGASRIREVDDSWPALGSRLHHSFGVWPAVVDDVSEVVEVEEGWRLVLRAKGWPMGEAEVAMSLALVPTGTRITIDEKAVRGPGVLLPSPVEKVVLGVRNKEALRRLSYLAERR